MFAIKTEHLTKFYGTSRGIIDLDLSVREGDFFGFIGPNGSGKSTTIRTLLGLIAPTSGSAAVLGHDIITDRQKILTEVGYLPSEASLYRNMKVKEVLSFSASMRKLDCKKTANELCERLQLDTDKKINELSFGNRKKVGVVCALQHRPRLLLLDEPTGGLDPLMQREFFTILKEYNNNGSTVFLSSHILSEIERYCNNAAIIRDGSIIASDSIEKLARTGIKRVNVKTADALPSLEFIKDLKISGENVSFLYNGDITALIKMLSKINVKDLNVSDPDLEDIVMHYYAKEDN